MDSMPDAKQMNEFLSNWDPPLPLELDSATICPTLGQAWSLAQGTRCGS